VQRREFPEQDSRWTHAAVFLYEDIVAEAVVWRGIHSRTLYRDVPGRLLRVRRRLSLTPDQRYKIALMSLRMVGQRYSVWTALFVFFHMLYGLVDRKGFSSRGVICSKVFYDAYAETTRSLLSGCHISQPVTPAHLSATGDLEDVDIEWLKLEQNASEFAVIQESPLEIVFDATNPGRKFWSIEPMRDDSGKQMAASFWEYRALIKNKSMRTLRNVKVVVEATGAMPTRPELSRFDINKQPLIDLTPGEETLAIIRRWFNPPIVAGMVVGEDAYGPIKMTASADDVLPTMKVFRFDPERTPMIFE
jgi:hypothetical protein